MEDPVPRQLLKLRRHLETLLQSELGQLSNGAKAVWVSPPRLSTKLSVKGLLCKIMRRTELVRSLHSPGAAQALRNEDWQIYLVQYDTSASGLGKLDKAIAKIQESFPRHRQINLNDLEDFYPQTRFLLNFSQLINLRQRPET